MGKKTLNSNLLNYAWKIDLVSHFTHAEGLVNRPNPLWVTDIILWLGGGGVKEIYILWQITWS